MAGVRAPGRCEEAGGRTQGQASGGETGKSGGMQEAGDQAWGGGVWQGSGIGGTGPVGKKGGGGAAEQGRGQLGQNRLSFMS